MEGMSIRLLVRKHPELSEYFPNIDLAMALQAVHDDYKPVAWSERLRSVATSNGLQDRAVNTHILATQ
jgi:hypothetical protein